MQLLNDIDVRIEPFVTNFEADVRDQPYYYIGQPYATENYIYVICANSQGVDSGVSNACELQVWTWEGTPVACYQFDREISLMTISEKYNKIFALHRRTDDELYIYDLLEF